MSHDAEFIDEQEFMGMQYTDCIRYLDIFFELESKESRLFSLDKHSFESGEIPEEIEDKIRSMITRGYLRLFSRYYFLLSISKRGYELMGRN